VRIEIWSHRRELLAGVTAAHQKHLVRESLFVRTIYEHCEGWGEVSPQPVALNGDPGLAEVSSALIDLCIRFVQRARVEEVPPEWHRVGAWSDGSSTERFAICALEMSLLDLHLRQTGESIDALWAPVFAPRFQATVSLMDPVWPVVDGASRVRVKASPRSWSNECALRLANLRAPVLLDLNGSGDSVGAVRDFAERVAQHCDLVALEQPFGAGDFVTTSQLARQVMCPVSLDESVRTRSDITMAAKYSAAAMVCIKPARVGGLSTARSLVRVAESNGLRAYIGGFFESPLGRAANHGLSANTTDEPGDVGPVALSTGQGGWLSDHLGFGFRPSEAFFTEAQLVGVVDGTT